MTQAVALAQQASTGVSPGFRNRIINGAMVIDQRNAGASVATTDTSAAVYTLDRWFYRVLAASKFTIQQDAGAVTPPAGFNDYIGFTSTSAYSSGAGDLFSVGQQIEGFNVADLNWGSANAKTVTLSFWVRSSLTGTFGGALRNSAGDRSYPFSYSISSANTWEQKSITIAGDTTGTWLTTNGIGISLRFDLGSGATYQQTAGAWFAGSATTCTGATNLVGTNGATLYITGVQLEVGSTATSFDTRSYTTELQLCQRYYTFSPYGTTSYPSTGGYARGYSSFKVTMRTTPTIAFVDAGSGGSSIGSSAYVDGLSNTYGSLTAAGAGTYSWTANAEL